jgi:hypothetical protein
MIANDDLWPEDLVAEIPRTPKDILLEQAAALGKKTKNVVRAKVRSRQDEEGDLVHRFVLYAPALGNYEYDLVSIWHDETLYPVSAPATGAGPGPKKLQDEEELRQYLRSFFGSERTLKIVRAMVANSRAEAPATNEGRDDDIPF